MHEVAGRATEHSDVSPLENVTAPVASAGKELTESVVVEPYALDDGAAVGTVEVGAFVTLNDVPVAWLANALSPE